MRLKSLRPIDDEFMRAMFRDNIPLAQYVLQVITGKSDLVITSCETQADMKRVTGARSICLDAYGTDTAGKKYDLEVQRADTGADPHRARYHSSVMDIENLDAGQDFCELPDTYTIFVTENDFYGKNKPVYQIQNMNVTLGEPFQDGAYILYVNGAYRDDSEIGKLMHDFSCTDASDMYSDLMAERTRYLKENREGVSQMSKVLEEMRDKAFDSGWKQGIEEGREQGREQGREEGREEGERASKMVIARTMLRNGMTEELIIICTGLTSEEISQLSAEPDE